MRFHRHRNTLTSYSLVFRRWDLLANCGRDGAVYHEDRLGPPTATTAAPAGVETPCRFGRRVRPFRFAEFD